MESQQIWKSNNQDCCHQRSIVGYPKCLEQGFNPDCVTQEKRLLAELEDLWQKDAMFWHQRSRIKWLQMGDKNSRFFHLSSIQGRQRNQIICLKDKDGVWRTEPKEIASLIKGHFQELYKPPPPPPPPVQDFNDLVSLIDPVISLTSNERLVREISYDEVKLVAFQLGPLKAPGLDGFSGVFFQSY